ncbi:MAG TPA: acetate/propionate family kinase [Pseudonocardiaceae bacterium]|nr:acetate/propionate family kinase [Pseudonocardiaceae bacterium]
MRVATVNPGSSSVKLAVVEDGGAVASAAVQAASLEPATEAFTDMVRQGQVDAVGVRFVHGGERSAPVVVDAEETARLAALTPLAPLHQPLSLALTDMIGRVMPSVPVVACFDTAFHATMPEPAARYALPTEWVRRLGLRRYGFHGLSCAHALHRSAELLDAAREQLRLLCCHIGAGVSVTAIRDGHGVDTSMGFTPLEGAVMATRSGSVDPGLLLYLLRQEMTDVPGLEQVLDRQSGLAGMSDTSGDIREVLAARAAGDPAATLAIQVYLHRLRREIGAQAMALDRLDAVVFTGGVAEHQPGLVSELIGGLTLLGLDIDPVRARQTGDRVISPTTAATSVLVVTAREDLTIARQTTAVVAALEGRLR